MTTTSRHGLAPDTVSFAEVRARTNRRAMFKDWAFAATLEVLVGITGSVVLYALFMYLHNMGIDLPKIGPWDAFIAYVLMRALICTLLWGASARR